MSSVFTPRTFSSSAASSELANTRRPFGGGSPGSAISTRPLRECSASAAPTVIGAPSNPVNTLSCPRTLLSGPPGARFHLIAATASGRQSPSGVSRRPATRRSSASSTCETTCLKALLRTARVQLALGVSLSQLMRATAPTG
ncbi:MAG: hypothetical protein H6Q89_5735 [Myxococcaceae bacterium]|nr:hypothetical protein [Myxococcaceae bacterium]